MPFIGDNRDAGDVIDVVSIDRSNGNETEMNKDSGIMANGNVNVRLQEINNIPEKRTTVEELIMNLATSGNMKQMKLATDLLELNMIHGNLSDNLSDTLGSDCFDKISVTLNENQNNEIRLDNNNETNMEWTTVRPKSKRPRSNSAGSNDSEKINVGVTVSPNKKQKSTENKTTGNDSTGSKARKGQGRTDQNTETISGIRKRNALNKDSVLVVVTEIPENTYFNSIKMENMILTAFPRLKETGMWTKYRVNKKHECKCYVTLPQDHFNEKMSEVIKSQRGFESCKVKIIKGINDVPEKVHKVVAIGVHQTISEEDIKTELAKNNVKINKVQRLKFNGQPTRKVAIQFENEQDMKIALFSGIYFGRMRIRCETYRTTAPVTQCYKCQGFNHLAKDCKNGQKCVRCAGPHKSTECPDKNKESLIVKCSNCNGNHVAASKECPKFKEQIKIQTERAKVRQEKLQNNLVVRGITFSNIVQNRTEKVQSDLTQKIQINKRETEQELDKVVQKLEAKLENSFKELSEKIVSFMVNSMLQIYEKLDRKNADKVYDILSKESVEHFKIRLDPVSPPLSPSTSVETSVTPVANSKNQNKTKKPNTQVILNKQVHPPRQLPIAQKIVAPRSKKLQNGNKK